MLELQNISKSFPGVNALSDVSIQFAPGEIHALVGENGAGKSTLIKILCGIYEPGQGSVRLDGKPIELHSYTDALAKKISLVSQEIQVIPRTTIAENIMLDKLDRFHQAGRINWSKVNSESARYVEMVELDLPVTKFAGELSAAQKQLVMIARALSSDARVLVLDEPTSSLALHEATNLLEILRKLKTQGVTIVFVSHKLEEVLAVADTVSVLRDGRLIGTRSKTELTKEDIVKMMIGRASRTEYLGSLDPDPNTIVLEARDISQEGRFDRVNFKLHKGEILGFYGLVGSGRTELAEILIGAARRSAGQVLVNGQVAHIHSMADSLYGYKMGYVSENRKEKGLILGATIDTNVTITVWNKILNRFRAIDLRKEDAIVRDMMRAVDVRATGPDQIVGRLSGGNQQKVSISKWLAVGCDILIVDEPTVGVDVGAKEYIHQLIWNLAKKEGKSIILISSDMPEMITLARRILVFRNYKIVGELDNLNDGEHSYEQVSQVIGKYLA